VAVKALILLLGIVLVSPDAALPQATGSVEGVVQLAPSQPRRSANRYPGAAASLGHAIHELPAVAYVVGSASTGGASELRATMTQRDTAFVPAVLAVRVGGTVSFPNSDPFFHNVFSYSSAQRFDLGRYPQGESKDVVFSEPGIVEVFCEVHEFMRGVIVVTENPYHAIVGADGRFRIPGIPAGEHTIAFWHPDYEASQQQVNIVPGTSTRVEVSLRR
jgi:plastocyanin